METKTLPLHNGLNMPNIGFGTFQIPDGEQTYDSVLKALYIGYKLIDTAAVYGNEKSVGKAIRQSGINRKDLFITTKLWNDDKGYKSAYKAFEKSMDKLGLDYLDLYLIHWPVAKKSKERWKEANLESWQAMSELYKKGKIKAIGVSNFLRRHIEALGMSTIKPMVNQIEFHPGYRQEDIVEYCQNNEIIVEAWAPLSQGAVMSSPEITDIGRKYGKTTAQTTLRWIIQKGIIPLPKSVTPLRIKENLGIFDFQLTPYEMEIIDSLEGLGGVRRDPDEALF